MTNTNKARGTKLERAVADYLADKMGDDRIDRLPLRGNQDRGDIGGVRTVMGEKVAVEVKAHARLDLSGWVAEAEVERGNADAAVGIVVHRRRGKGQPADQYVTLTLAGLVILLGGTP